MTLHHGDCRAVMGTIDPASIDAIVTDPPYGLEFMGKEWDRPWAVDAKSPVGYAGREDNLTLPSYSDNRNANCRACGGRQRGKKRCTCATPEWDRNPTSDSTELQAWHESWAREAYRILKPGGHLVAFGGTRTFHRLTCAIEDAGFEIRDCLSWLYGSGFPKSHNLPGGLGTALKPGWEPIVLARRPLIGTVARNVGEHSTGALNIDGCRIEGVKGVPASPCRVDSTIYGAGSSTTTGGTAGFDPTIGRWPANVVLDETVALQMGDKSRYFYQPKASRAERNAGLEGMPEKARPGAFDDDNYEWKQPNGHVVAKPTANHHPTVKPVALMRWLVRLVTPPGGTVLDPFLGSGTTGIAAELEGMAFVGIEQDAEYLEIARHRIAHVAQPLAALAAD